MARKKGSQAGLPLHECRKAVELRRLLRFLAEEFGDDLVNDLIDQRANFIRRFGLNRVSDENWFILRQS